MRNPNGYGTVFKLSGNRRRPWVAKASAVYDDTGKGKQPPIGYFKTKKEAVEALAAFNTNPYDLDGDKMTFSELYTAWYESKCETINSSSLKGFRWGYNKSAPLHDKVYSSLRVPDFQKIIDSGDYSSNGKITIRNLYRKLDKYALEHDLITKGYAGFVEVHSTKIKKEKHPFSNTEINRVWTESGDRFIDGILILLYTGMRAGELMSLENKNIFLEKNYMRGGEKTEFGKERVIPIHHRIKPLIEKYKTNEKYFMNDYYDVSGYGKIFRKKMTELGMHHTSHECRHTVRSELDRVGANKVSIDLIMGHKSQGVGERHYTHKTIQELINTIELITY